MLRFAIYTAIVTGLVITGPFAMAADSLMMNPDDHVCIIGNTLADRMQHDGWLEAMLQHEFPAHRLVIRNLGFSGDELNLRLRSSGFGSPDDHLRFNRADVVLAFFGYNESFAGPAGLEAFRHDLLEFVDHVRGQDYNGRSAPRLVLCSPIAHENLHSPNLPDGSANNARLQLYAQAMAEVAAAKQVTYIDLFRPTQVEYERNQAPLTINGIHLNSLGNQFVAQVIHAALAPKRVPLDWQTDRLAEIRAAVLHKNFYWFNRYRTTDGYSIYGGRADLQFVDGQTNRVVTQREMEVLDALTAQADQQIWALAQGQAAADPQALPEFIPVVTNKPGLGFDGQHVFLSGEQAIEKMTIADRMRVELFASEETFPELVNPVQMAFDTRGRLWVCAWESYPHWKPTEEMNDKLLILEDTNHDGRADTCKTFAAGLHNPTGFEFYGGGVIVAMVPDLIFLQDNDGDGVADRRERILHGLCSADTHHAANSFVLDPSGGLYFQEGTFHHTQVETPYGPAVRSANAAMYRFEPRTSKFEVYVAYGFANPHGHVFDRWGQDFLHDGTGAVPYHGTLFSGHLDFPAKHASPPTLYQQRTRPCPATEIVSGEHFPPEMQGNLLVGNVIGLQGILQYRFRDRGASFIGEEVEPILFSSDPNFRPVDLEIAPDGSLYFTDWQNPIIGHMQHNLRDPSRDRTHGRVYRVTYQDRPVASSPKIGGESVAQLVSLLAHPGDRIRYRARIELSARPSDQVLAAAMQWLATLDRAEAEFPHHLTEALWLHQWHHVPNRELLNESLASPDFHARAAAVRVACAWRDHLPDTLAILKRMAADDHPRVRLEAIRAASFFKVAEAIEVPLISTEYPTDEYLDYTRNETLRALEPYWKKAIEEGHPIAVSSEVGMRWLLQRVRVDELIRMPRSAALYDELLLRDDVPDSYRQESLRAVAEAEQIPPVTILLRSLTRLDQTDAARTVSYDLGRLLANWPTPELRVVRPQLQDMALAAQSPIHRQLAIAALMMADQDIEPAWRLALQSVVAIKDTVAALALLPDPVLQDQLAAKVEPLLDDVPEPLKTALGNRLATQGTYGRYVRVELPGRRRTLTLAEVEVLSDGKNVARHGRAAQSATAHGGSPERAIDGNRDGRYASGTQTHTPEDRRDPWWEVDLGEELPLESVTVHNRTDGTLGERLEGYTLQILDGTRNVVVEFKDKPAPNPLATVTLESGGPRGTLRRAAMESLPYVRGREAATFVRLAQFIQADVDRVPAMRAMLRTPSREWPQDKIGETLAQVMAFVSRLPAEERGLPAASDAIQLADTLAGRLPPEEAVTIRRQLRQLGVRKLRLGTVPHRMVYDQDRLVVSAGKQVEITFENNDIMPHNVVITQPGALEEVGLLAESTGQQPGALQRHFVPPSARILLASELLQPRESQTLSFVAPTEPGIYPFVCTYPGHWRRMYGSVIVVADLDSFEADEVGYLAANKIAPVDELLKTVRPLREWKLDDLQPALTEFEHGRSFASGRRMFQIATCVSCHRMNGEGHEIGPDLMKLDPKLTTAQILKHLVEPSAEINKDFQTIVIELKSGKILTGLVVAQDPDSIKFVENPLVSPQPQVIRLSDIENQDKSLKSLMPEGLLDRLTRDEILDLLAYVVARGSDQHQVFQEHHHH